MAIPAYLFLTDETGALVKGGVNVIGREGSIELLSFTHGVSIPFDGTRGRLSGNRKHHAMHMEKEFDCSSPYLYRAVCESKKIQSAEIRWYQINDAGMEEEFFKMQMESVLITSVNPKLPHIKHSDQARFNPSESFGLAYEKITWKFLKGNIQYTDQWSWGHYI